MQMSVSDVACYLRITYRRDGVHFPYRIIRLRSTAGITLFKNRRCRRWLLSSFVIVSKTALPQFDDNFVDYGYNKVQWITLLRYSGFKFSVLSNSWAFHMRHNPYVVLFYSE